jgi:hypothetical protein
MGAGGDTIKEVQQKADSKSYKITAPMGSTSLNWRHHHRYRSAKTSAVDFLPPLITNNLSAARQTSPLRCYTAHGLHSS